MNATMMHFAILIPDWNSLESVRRAHSDLEGAALVFFALLVLFDVLAHFSDDKKRERLLEKIGLCFFAIAVLAEILAYPYGQRNDALSEQVIRSLDATARDAFSNATKALTDSGHAETLAQHSSNTADAVSQEADGLSARIQHEAALLETMTPRGVLLQSSKQSLTKNLIPFAGQKAVVTECGFSMPKNLYSTLDKEQEEKDGAWASISQILGDDAKWSSHPGIFEKCASLGGVTVWVNMSASPNTQKAANVLSKELARVLGLQPAPFLAKGGSDLGLPPIDEQAPWTLIARDPERIVVSVGVWSLPWATPEAMKKSIARSKKFAERRNKLAKP